MIDNSGAKTPSPCLISPCNLKMKEMDEDLGKDSWVFLRMEGGRERERESCERERVR